MCVTLKNFFCVYFFVYLYFRSTPLDLMPVNAQFTTMRDFFPISLGHVVKCCCAAGESGLVDVFTWQGSIAVPYLTASRMITCWQVQTTKQKQGFNTKSSSFFFSSPHFKWQTRQVNVTMIRKFQRCFSSLFIFQLSSHFLRWLLHVCCAVTWVISWYFKSL